MRTVVNEQRELSINGECHNSDDTFVDVIDCNDDDDVVFEDLRNYAVFGTAAAVLMAGAFLS